MGLDERSRFLFKEHAYSLGSELLCSPIKKMINLRKFSFSNWLCKAFKKKMLALVEKESEKEQVSHLLATIESKFGYMLENLCIFDHLEASLPSENFKVQTISREDL